ncbi:YphA family membrane protein [Metabacillus sp. 113a]|uniref:YphA family membrane protein n=1 Tax=Metabacillus sp. 113a TaxID=3404706 RepID=UPI003CF46DDA
MEGIYFYWIAWCLWIGVTFIMQKSNRRTFLSYFLLLLIIWAGFAVKLPIGELSPAYLMLLLAGFGMAAHYRMNGLKLMLCSMGLGAGYAGLKLMQLYDPVWFTISPAGILLIVCFCAAGVLGKLVFEKLPVFLIGCCTGELLYEIIIYPISGSVQIGQPAFLDFILFGAAGFTFWGLLKGIGLSFSTFLQKPGKAKQSNNA